MTGVSKLYCGSVEASDVLRYGRRSADLPSGLLQFSADKKPVVVWNCTRACNLRCRHCYSGSSPETRPSGELTTAEAEAMIDDLAAFGSPVILFSGGEPLLRGDLVHLVSRARARGMRAVLSTNGTLLTDETVGRLSGTGLSYIGVSLDGPEAVHDSFRRVEGAWRRAVDGIRRAKAAGIKTGLRFTITRANMDYVPDVFAFMKREGVDRACFYHLVSAGRGAALDTEALTHDETRRVVRTIMDLTKAWFAEGGAPEILTVDNHADGPFIYLELMKEDPVRAAAALELLKMNGGNSSGHGIGSIGWDGEVYADQFSRDRSYGNVRKTPFSEIWRGEALAPMREKAKYVTGRCAACRWLGVCAGNLRARAASAGPGAWAPDPACYLTDGEIA